MSFHENESWYRECRSELCRLICVLGCSTVSCAHVWFSAEGCVTRGRVLSLVLLGALNRGRVDQIWRVGIHEGNFYFVIIENPCRICLIHKGY
jgi:hypothetical protein